MARYIDADALIENIKRVYCKDCNNYNEVRCRACGTDDAMAMIDDAPTVNVAEALYDLKRRVHDKAVYPNNSGIDPYISLKVFDAVLQKQIDKIKGDI